MTSEPQHAPWRAYLLAAILLSLPTVAVLCMHGSTALLRLNALGLHDGMHYYGVSLSPLGDPAYSQDPVRYSRAFFPAVVYAVAALLAPIVRAAAGDDWLHATFEYDGFTVPNYALLHACIYHACLLAATWVSTLVLARFLRNITVAILINVVLMQPFLLKGLLTPIDIALVIACIWAIERWMLAEPPSWRAVVLLALALAAGGLNREVYFGFFPVVVVCHVSRFRFKFILRLAAALALSLASVAVWYVAVSATQDRNLLDAVRDFMKGNSTLLPLQDFPAAIRARPLEAPFLIALTAYIVVRMVLLLREEIGRWRRGEPLSPANWWGMVICVVALRASTAILESGMLNFARVLLYAPFLLQDAARIYDFLRNRLGPRLMLALVSLATAGYLALVVWYQSGLIATHFARIKAFSDVQNATGLKHLPAQTPTIYRP